jgi:hypothetical protein
LLVCKIYIEHRYPLPFLPVLRYLTGNGWEKAEYYGRYSFLIG